MAPKLPKKLGCMHEHYLCASDYAVIIHTHYMHFPNFEILTCKSIEFLHVISQLCIYGQYNMKSYTLIFIYQTCPVLPFLYIICSCLDDLNLYSILAAP